MNRLALGLGLAMIFAVGLILITQATPVATSVRRFQDQWMPVQGVEEADPAMAVFNDPSGLSLDANGVLYFSERRTHLIRSLSNGRLEIVAGTGRKGYTGDGVPARQARLNYPEGLAVDSSGNLYIADSKNHRIRRIDRAGIVSTVAGNGESGFSGDGLPAVAAQLDQPMDIAFGPSGSLYIADWGNHRIRRVDQQGTISTVAGTGQAGFSGDRGPAYRARLDGPYGLWVDWEEHLWIADSHNHRVRRVGRDGVITTVAGTGEAGFSGDGGPALAARFDSPQAVLVTTAGSVLINDEHNHRIRAILPDGRVRTIVGSAETGFCGDGGPATEACLHDPEDMVEAPSGDLYLTDGDNHRIRAVDPTGMIHTLAGTGPVGRKRG
jgi:DNA-binding beta-propeller fold protein YncE